MSIKFPEDFRHEDMSYNIIEHGFNMQKDQWIYPKNAIRGNEGEEVSNILISVIGGDHCYGDGIGTFEMWDFRETEPRGHMTANQINKYLANHPFPQDNLNIENNEEEF